jgi:glutamate dehydrogenase (NADP+)
VREAEMENGNVLEDAVRRLERIGEEAGVSAEVIDVLRYPRECLLATLSVRMDDGSTEHFQAYRCRYNSVLGPTKGGIFSKTGFDVESLYHYKQDTRELRGVYCAGSVCELVDHEKISNQELLELDVEMLIPAALGSVIGEANAERIKTPIIVEVANGPIAGQVDEILEDRGTLVLPDVLANAGGVTVSYFEWVQNRQGYAWNLEEVRSQLEERLSAAFSEIWDVHQNERRSLRAATYAIAMRRIAEAVEAGGTREYFQQEDA